MRRPAGAVHSISLSPTPLIVALLAALAGLPAAHAQSGKDAAGQDPTTLDQVQVTGIRESMQSSINKKRDDTVIVVGAANDHGTGVLDDLDQVRTGEEVVLTTQTGTLTYRITELIHADPNRVLDLPQVSAHVPGRLVIDRANYVNHNRSGQDLVVIATLVKAEALRP